MDLRKSAMAARIAKLPQLPPNDAPPDPEVDEDEEAEARDGLGSLSMAPPVRKASKTTHVPNPTLSPLSASTHFTQATQVSVPASDLDFRVYITPPTTKTKSNEIGSVMVCHHGAGYSALSFACLAKEVTQTTAGELGIIAFDARAHGRTTSLSNPGMDPSHLDLSLSTLTSDFINLITTIYPEPTSSPSLILVGHSMGGAIFTNAVSQLLALKYQVTGVCVIDVVEGSAMEALPHMHQLLASRPDGFQSQEQAVEWHTTGHTGSNIQNTLSARLSVPSLVVKSSQEEIDSGLPLWKWRTPLKSTAPFWESWFSGLSKSFLAARTARLLILAGTDRLDRELMIGQMMGKFQLVVIPDVGHMVQEDNPERAAQIIIEFWKRNERIILPGIKKVGEA